MGLGTKIKEALHSDHQTTTSSPSSHTQSTGNYNTPGAFPNDDLSQRHTDGKNYTAPHGTAVDDTKKVTGATSGLASSGTQSNRISKGADEYGRSHDTDSKLSPGHHTRDSAVHVDQATGQDPASKGAYWGDLSKDGQRGAAQDLPDRTRLDEDTPVATGRQHGVSDHHHDRHLANQAVGGGVYNASPAQGSHGATNRDPTEDSRFGEDLTGTTGRHHGGPGFHEQHLAGQPQGGGVTNSLTGLGSPQHYGTRTSQPGTVHDPLSSGSKGIPLSSGNTSGNNFDHQTAGYGGDGLTTQNDRIGHNHGLGGAGTAAGVGAVAGYGAHEYGHHSKGNNASDGVPRSSMLNPEPAFNSSNSPAGGQSGLSGYNVSENTHAYGSRVANADTDREIRGIGTGSHRGTGGQTGQFSGGLPNANTNTNTGAGFGHDSSASPTQSASSGSGRKHFGPGHEGAKVMHSCQRCGEDNDISHYFSKDVVYRLGQ